MEIIKLWLLRKFWKLKVTKDSYFTMLFIISSWIYKYENFHNFVSHTRENFWHLKVDSKRQALTGDGRVGAGRLKFRRIKLWLTESPAQAAAGGAGSALRSGNLAEKILSYLTVLRWEIHQSIGRRHQHFLLQTMETYFHDPKSISLDLCKKKQWNLI